ncbi:MAG TPA: AraC family transcriptional regulator [Chitinophagaceae bacterium]|nr:AraC family transcriptional regulator [Chitinophagaceae bacterium]
MNDNDNIKRVIRERNRLKEIINYVEANIDTNLQGRTVAEKCNVSVSTLFHLFKKHHRLSFHTYVEMQRMDKALHLLQNAGMSVKEVMYATGYKNKKTFNKAFKKKFRYTPGHFKI